MQIDLAVTPADRLRVALQLPDGLAPRRGGVRLDVLVTRPRQAGRHESLALAETLAPADTAGLSARRKSGFTIVAYRLSPENAVRFAALQREIIQSRSVGQSGALGFGIDAREFCRTADQLPAILTASTYIATAETRGWLTVTDGFELRSDPRIAEELASLRRC